VEVARWLGRYRRSVSVETLIGSVVVDYEVTGFKDRSAKCVTNAGFVTLSADFSGGVKEGFGTIFATFAFASM
jgi:hypothetical protein